MIVYLDASCLVKLYVEEDGSADVRLWCDHSAAVATTRLAFVESVSALTRRHREGDLTEIDAGAAVSRLEADWPAFVRVDVDEALAGDVARRHDLRALDAVHLAAALTLSVAMPDVEVVFVTRDRRQALAAAAEGLRLAR